MIHRIAVGSWMSEDDIARSISHELIKLGYEPVIFPCDGCIPKDVDLVLTFAPYGKLLPVARQMADFPTSERPVYLHWNTENPPDPHLPWPLTNQIAMFRCWIDRLDQSQVSLDRYLSTLKPVQWLQQRMFRFRYQGDYCYAYNNGWLDFLAEYSNVYAQQYVAHGIPSAFVPWGTSQEWHTDLMLERDIDVLWFGKRRTKRRSNLIDRIQRELQSHGLNVHIVDGILRPFIYGRERLEILNRSKITISLLTHSYESVFPHRFHMAAGNRCMVISEHELNHHPECISGKHYIEAKANEIVDKALYYLNHDDERLHITENAYRLVTQELTLANSLKKIIHLAETVRRCQN